VIYLENKIYINLGPIPGEIWYIILMVVFLVLPWLVNWGIAGGIILIIGVLMFLWLVYNLAR